MRFVRTCDVAPPISPVLWCWVVAIGLLLTFPVPAAYAEEELRIANDYIAVIVNSGDENTGRFSIQTTGGDPTRSDDNNQLMLYKQTLRGPWTSYTTVRIDGVDYVFGGETRDRAGLAGRYGTVIQPPVIDTSEGDQRIVATWRLGPAIVTQTLQFVRSSTTGLFDTARIAYTVENVGDTAHQVGVRVVLDTMLGANDGAPFRVGERAIVTDTVYQSQDLPDFWQAFDSVSNPRVIGQGTLRGPGISTPDRVYFTNWGALADGPWDFSFNPGRDFTRLGEFDLDSAMALFWNPAPLAPGERREYVTHYGMGGISIVRGHLSLGITSPASIEAGRQDSFPVIVYVQNTGEGEARDVTLEICVPTGLRLAGGARCETRAVGHLPVGRVAQMSWDVHLDGAIGGELEYTVVATAENLPDPVRVSRRIEILGPPRLAVSVAAPEGRIIGIYDRWNPPRQPIAATVTNVGATSAKDVVVTLSAPVGMELAPVDRAIRSVGELAPGESWTVTWHAALLGYTGNLPFTVTATDRASEAPAVTQTRFLDMFFPQQGLVLLPGKGSVDNPVAVGQVFAVDVMALNVRRLLDLAVEVEYDPTRLALVQGTPGLFGAFRGDLFLLTADERRRTGSGDQAVLMPWEIRPIPTTDGKARIRIEATRGDVGPLAVASGSVASLRFLPLAAGETPVSLSFFRVGESRDAPSPSQIERRGIVVHVVP